MRKRMRATLRNGRCDWYKIEMRADAAEVMIYDEIGYYGVEAGQFVKDLNEISVNTINLRINSPGGDVFDAVAIYNALKNHSATVNVSVDGWAASAASFIAQAGDTRCMQLGSQMMIHDANTLAIGNGADLRTLADLLDRTSDSIADIYAARCGGTAADWRKRMKAETWYSANEAVSAGLADSVAGGEDDNPDEGDVAARWDLSIFSYAGRAAAPEPEIPIIEPVTVPDDLWSFDPNVFANAAKAAFSPERGQST